MKKSLVVLFVAVVCLSIAVLPLSAAEQVKEKPSIYGAWKIAMQFEGGRAMNNRMTITEKPGALPDIKWGLGSGEGKITDIKFANNKLTFLRISPGRGGEEMETDVEATLQEDRTLKGTMTSDFGEFTFTGTRIVSKPDVAGKWEFKSTRDANNIRISVLSITQNDKGLLEGKWSTERGETVLSNLKYEKGKLTFERTTGSGDREFKSTFTGEVKGDELVGEFASDRGNRPSTGTRMGKELIGEWDLKVVSDFGERTNKLLVDKDMSAVFSMGFGESDVNDLKLDGDKLTFNISFGFGDRSFSMDFSGKLSGDALKGQFTSDRGTQDVDGKRVMPKVEPVNKEMKKDEEKPTEAKKEQ